MAKTVTIERVLEREHGLSSSVWTVEQKIGDCWAPIGNRFYKSRAAADVVKKHFLSVPLKIDPNYRGTFRFRNWKPVTK